MVGWLPILHIIWPNWVEIWRYHRFDPQRNSVFRLLKELPTASGVVSLGIFAKGWFSLGVFSLGIFSAGGCSLGLFSLGMMAGGFVALGNLCLGAVALGNISMGLWTIGNLCIGLFCLGNLGIGVIGLGNRLWAPYAYQLPDTAQWKDIQLGIHELSKQLTNSVYQKWILAPFVYFIEHPVLLLIVIIGVTFVIFVPIASLMYKLVSGRLKFGN